MVRQRDNETGLIVHVGPDSLQLPAERGGAIERRMVALAQAQLALGLRPVIYSWGSADGETAVGGVPIRYCVTAERPGPARRLHFAWRFLKSAPTRAASVVHLHSRPDIAWLLRASGVDTPTVLSCDNHLQPGYRWPWMRPVSKAIWRRCLSSASVIAPVSEYCCKVHKEYWGLDPSRFVIIPNGVDLDHFRPMADEGQEWRRRLGVDGKQVLLYVGRICRQKGSDTLLHAYELLRRTHPDVALVVVGPAEQFGNAGGSSLLADLRKSGVYYLPPVDDACLPGIYNACDIFVMPTQELEMFGMAAVEAQACGKPVVASDHGGLRETVPDSAGLRFPSGESEALANQLAVLLSSLQLRRRLGEGALQNAARYSWVNVALECQNVYAAARSLPTPQTPQVAPLDSIAESHDT